MIKQVAGWVKCAFTVAVLLILVACGTSPQEVVIRDVNEPNYSTTSTTSRTVSSVGERDSSTIETSVKDGVKTHSGKGVLTRELTTTEVQPVYSASARIQSPLQKSLLVSAQNKLAENDPEGAIVLAEKGLRIDRKDPQFYIVLADAYERIDNNTQSSYFAQQGLRYVQKDSQEYRALQRWLP